MGMPLRLPLLTPPISPCSIRARFCLPPLPRLPLLRRCPRCPTPGRRLLCLCRALLLSRVLRLPRYLVSAALVWAATPSTSVRLMSTRPGLLNAPIFTLSILVAHPPLVWMALLLWRQVVLRAQSAVSWSTLFTLEARSPVVSLLSTSHEVVQLVLAAAASSFPTATVWPNASASCRLACPWVRLLTAGCPCVCRAALARRRTKRQLSPLWPQPLLTLRHRSDARFRPLAQPLTRLSSCPTTPLMIGHGYAMFRWPT